MCNWSSTNYTAATKQAIPEKLYWTELYSLETDGSKVMSQWPRENKVPHPRLGTSLQGLRTVRRQNQGSVKKKWTPMVYRWKVIIGASMEIIRERLPQRPERPLWILCFRIARQNHTREEREQGKDILNLIFQCTICGQILLLSTLILKQALPVPTEKALASVTPNFERFFWRLEWYNKF